MALRPRMRVSARVLLVASVLPLAATVDGFAAGCVRAAGGGGVVAIASERGLTLVSPKAARDIALGAPASTLAWSTVLNCFVATADRALWTVEARGASHRVARLPGRGRSLAVAPGPGAIVAVSTDGVREGVTVYGVGRDRARRLGGGVEPRRVRGRVAIGDGDGDGRFEVLVLVTGRTRFDARERLRPFVYGWDGTRLYPKWLGSRLSRPFDDAVLGNVDGDAAAELVAVEHTRDGRRELAAYDWSGFGFERAATSSPASDICGLEVDREARILALVDRAPCAFRVVADRLEPHLTGAGPRDAVVALDGVVVGVTGRSLYRIHGESIP